MKTLTKMRPMDRLLEIMAALRGPDGCPWDKQQDHASIRFHAVEEVYEMIDAIEAGDDLELQEELGDLLLQVVFHAQLARERGAFDFEAVCRRIAEKLIRRHPHVFGDKQASTAEAVWAQWEQIKQGEKEGTRHQRESCLDGIPRHLPSLLRIEKLVKKARKAGLAEAHEKLPGIENPRPSKAEVAALLFDLTAYAKEHGWSAEELLRKESGKRERSWRKQERKTSRI